MNNTFIDLFIHSFFHLFQHEQEVRHFYTGWNKVILIAQVVKNKCLLVSRPWLHFACY